MTNQEHPEAAIALDIDPLSGERVVARGVAYDDYLSGQYGRHAEWVQGVVIAVSPTSITHERLVTFLRLLFSLYLDQTGGGEVFGDPVVMRPAPDLPARQPDIQVILPAQAQFVQRNQVAGPAALVVEVVSPESVDRDRGAKFKEYEAGGVGEYWIVDADRREALFYVRDDDGLFRSRLPVEGVYASHVLPRLRLPVGLLWHDSLPTASATMQMVEQMLTQG
jgi:Uma2 family endonuclease